MRGTAHARAALAGAALVRTAPTLLSLALAGCAGSAAVPDPGEGEVARARAVDPSADRPLLVRGRERYVHRCGGCHVLPAASALGAREWPGELDLMAPRARLSADERRAIQLYLVAVSSGPGR